MKLTPEDLQKLQTKQLANIIRKLGEGKTITAREQAMLDDARAAGPEENASAARTEAINFVRNWDDLAQELGVSRKSVQNWRTREDLRSAPDFPRPRADGRHDVSAWSRFMVAHGLKRADEDVDPEDLPEERRTAADWKTYREQLQCKEIERRIARGDGLLLVATDLEIPLGSTFVAIQTKLSQFPARAARFMVNKRDEASAEATLRDEIDAILADLNAANYLEETVDAIAQEFPFNAEASELYAKVSFAGQDGATFVQLIRVSMLEALRRIGRRALTTEASTDTPPAHEEKDARASQLAGQQPVATESAPPNLDLRAVPKPRAKSRKAGAEGK